MAIVGRLRNAVLNEIVYEDVGSWTSLRRAKEAEPWWLEEHTCLEIRKFWTEGAVSGNKENY